jgi:ATP-dependent DNA helicase RecG
MRPSILNPLFADVTALPGIGPKLAALIARAAGPRVVDLLFTPPASVIDRSARPKIADAPFGALVTLDVRVDSHQPPPSRRVPYRVICSDETGFLTLVFFHAKADYLKRALPEGQRRLVSGRLEDYDGRRQMTHPDHIGDPADPASLPLFEPVYPLTANLSPNVMRKAVQAALQRARPLPEWQDAAWLSQKKWPSWKDALDALHAPTSAADLALSTPARQRLAYDELLSNQLALLLIRRARVKTKGRPIKGDGRLRAKAIAALPFALTAHQKQALAEIDADMASSDRMVRLLQGDVGAGKTVVAFLARSWCASILRRCRRSAAPPAFRSKSSPGATRARPGRRS